jgi:uncharacterized membrane protein
MSWKVPTDKTMYSANLGHPIFAVTMIALGILGLTTGDFTPVWGPVSKDTPAREVLVHLCALVSLGCGAGLLWERAAASAARLLLAYLLLWTLAMRVPEIFPAPAAVGSWYGCAETAVLVAGAWVLYAWFASDWDKRHLRFATGHGGRRIARTIYGVALMFFGLSHFIYLHQTVALVPSWLPIATAWAHFTGGTYIAAGVAMITGVCSRLAAALSVLQMGLFTLLVWLPTIVASTPATAYQWSETILSWTLTTSGWVVADSYRDSPFVGLD